MLNPAVSTEKEGRAPAAPLAIDTDDERDQGSILSFPRLRRLSGRPALLQWAEYLSFGVAWFTTGLAFLLTVAIIGCILTQIFFRYLLNAPLSWTDETAIFLFVWITLLFASICVRERAHARFTALVNTFPPIVSLVLDRLIMAMIAVFAGSLVYISQEMLDLVWDNRSPAVNYPMQFLYFAVPIHAVFILIHAVTNIFIGPEAGSGDGVH